MKNLVLILSVAISLSILCGCSDSDSTIIPGSETETETETPPDEIIGYWKLTKIVKDGIDLTDDCTTQSDMTITKFNTISGKDYDVVQNGCFLSRNFSGRWVHKNSNKYTFSIFGNPFNVVLNSDTIIRSDFIHAIDGQHYLLEHIKQQ